LFFVIEDRANRIFPMEVTSLKNVCHNNYWLRLYSGQIRVANLCRRNLTKNYPFVFFFVCKICLVHPRFVSLFCSVIVNLEYIEQKEDLQGSTCVV